MDGFFGIGIGELVMIAIVALIVLGPERLPGALREVAKFIRQLRNLSHEFTDQFGDEFKALEDLNPRRILQDAIESIDEEEKGKEAPKSAKKSTTSTTTKTTPKPSTAKSTTPKTTPAATPKPKPLAPKAADSNQTVARDTATAATATVTSDPVTATDNGAEPAATAATTVDAAPENRIAPPSLEADAALAPAARSNGHHPEGKSAEAVPLSIPASAAPAAAEPAPQSAVSVTHPQDGGETSEG